MAVEAKKTDPKNPIPVGERVKFLMEKAGIKASQLAYDTGFSVPRINNYRDGREPKYEDRVTLARALKPHLGPNLEVFLGTGLFLEDYLGNFKPPKFSVEDAKREFKELIKDAEAGDFIKMKPGFSSEALCDSFAKAVGKHITK